MGKYSLNTTGAFEEVPIKTSKADFVVVNKKMYSLRDKN